ncbi:DUF397 domain-containing protein [Streptomyces acidiscabies]
MLAIPDLSIAQWRKSSYSDGEPGGECLEVADGIMGFNLSATVRRPSVPP